MLRTPTSLPTCRVRMSPVALRSVVWTVRTAPSRSTVTANARTGPTGLVVSSPSTIRTAAATVATTRRTRSSEPTLGKERPTPTSGAGSGRWHVPVGELGDREQRVRVGHGEPGGGIVRLGACRRRRHRRLDRGRGLADDGLGVGRAGRAAVGGRREHLVERREGWTSAGSGIHAAASCGSARAGDGETSASSERSSSAGRSDGSGTGSHDVGVVRHRARATAEPNARRNAAAGNGERACAGAGSRRVARIALCVIGDRVRLAGSVSGGFYPGRADGTQPNARPPVRRRSGRSAGVPTKLLVARTRFRCSRASRSRCHRPRAGRGREPRGPRRRPMPVRSRVRGGAPARGTARRFPRACGRAV